MHRALQIVDFNVAASQKTSAQAPPPVPSAVPTVSNDAALIFPSSAVAIPPQPPTIVPPTVTRLEYGPDVFEHFLVRERSLMRNPNYMASQTEVTEKMRIILLDWLVDVHIRFRHRPETFYLAVDIVDRYLGCCPVTRAKLQLVGVTALLIAAKHEEIFPPELHECVFICANTYSSKEIVDMEVEIASVLQFKFSVPTPYPFLAYLLAATSATTTMRCAAMQFLEYSALNYATLKHLPSTVALSCYLLANMMIRESDCGSCWLQEVTNTPYMDTDDLRACTTEVLRFATLHSAANGRYQAVRRKYTSGRYEHVADRTMPTDIPSSLQAAPSPPT